MHDGICVTISHDWRRTRAQSAWGPPTTSLNSGRAVGGCHVIAERRHPPGPGAVDGAVDFGQGRPAATGRAAALFSGTGAGLVRRRVTRDHPTSVPSQTPAEVAFVDLGPAAVTDRLPDAAELDARHGVRLEQKHALAPPAGRDRFGAHVGYRLWVWVASMSAAR
jgi:hypothetical protein